MLRLPKRRAWSAKDMTFLGSAGPQPCTLQGRNHAPFAPVRPCSCQTRHTALRGGFAPNVPDTMYLSDHAHDAKREVAKYNESQEEFKKLQVTLRNASRRFEMCRQLGGSSILPDHLPSPQAVLLDMRVAGAVDESGAKKVCRSVGVGVGKGIMHKYTGTGLLDMHVSKACDEKKGSNLLVFVCFLFFVTRFVIATKRPSPYLLAPLLPT
eukprot:scaffold46388_cov19-Tisochrysis_lutea.AAC.2